MRPLALWATPRTASTAFDKMMRTRGDHRVFTEPFSIPWYLGPEQRSDRYRVTQPEVTFAGVLAAVRAAARTEPVFLKEMAYQLGPLLEADVLAEFSSTFLVRDPAGALPSLARMWPDFTDTEAGYAAQHRAWTMLREAGEAPVVVDSDDLRRDPERIVAAWCAAVEIDYRPDSLSWEPSMPSEWEPWADWFRSSAASTGFRPPVHAEAAPSDDPDLQLRIDLCRPFYEELAADRLAA